MRILWVKANKLVPPQSGGDIRSYHIARSLASRHDLTFLSYYDGAVDPEYESALCKEFPGAVSICTGKLMEGTARRAMDYLRMLAREAPYAVSRFASKAVRTQIANWFETGAFDLAVCDFLDAAVNFPDELTIPTVLFQHNVESEIWRRHLHNSCVGLQRLAYGIEFLKMQRYERQAVRHFEHVIAVSKNDKEIMSMWADPSRISVIATGVDLAQFRPDPSNATAGPLVMFVGAMDWMPNVDAVSYFCEQIWPRVQERLPEARFRIVGRNPVPQVQTLASSSIEVTGRVSSVIEHLRQAAVVVVPLRVGGGTRLKIYEAMAAGKAVISTTIGAEGLDVHDGEDILLADDPARFAEAVTLFLKDASLRIRYGRAASALASNYDWPAVGSKFGEILEQRVVPNLNALPLTGVA